jgi:hypothetical protein
MTTNINNSFSPSLESNGVYVVYRYYIKIKSTWDLLAINEGIDSIIVDVLTAICAYKNSIRKDYGLERWKSPFKEMMIESINMLDTTPDLIKRDSNLLEMLRNIVSTYYDVCTNKLEEQYRRRHQMTYIPCRRINVTNSAIIWKSSNKSYANINYNDIQSIDKEWFSPQYVGFGIVYGIVQTFTILRLPNSLGPLESCVPDTVELYTSEEFSSFQVTR